MPKRIVNVGICTVDAIGQYVDAYPDRKGLALFDQLARLLSGLDDVSAMTDEFRQRGCKNAVIKLDVEGAFCLSESGRRHRVTAYRPKNVVDATGAGDTWCAGFLAGLANDFDLLECVRLGHAVAAHCIRHTGASAGIPALDDVRKFQSVTSGGQVRSIA